MHTIRLLLVGVMFAVMSGRAVEIVPQGLLTKGVLAESKLFPNARHEFQVYVPARYAGATPAALMVF